LAATGKDMMQSLCESCRQMREETTPKGSRFLLCQLSQSNPTYPKYPPQPIVRCHGYEQKQTDETPQEKGPMAKKHKTVLFLCTGNYYRSRFAEVLFVSVARKMGLPWNANSKGLALERGVNNVGPMASAAINVLEAMGIRDGDRCTRIPAQATAVDLELAEVYHRSETRRTSAVAARAISCLCRKGRVLAR
jgi:protein-tyrosine-phosphatase